MTHICCKVIHQSRYHQQNNCAYFSQSCEGQLEKEVEAVNDAHVTSLHCCKVLQHEVPDLKEQEVTGVRSLKTLLHFETIRLCISLFIHVFAKCKCFQLEHKIFGLSYETFYHVNECKKQPREFYLYCNYNKVESVTCPLTNICQKRSPAQLRFQTDRLYTQDQEKRCCRFSLVWAIISWDAVNFWQNSISFLLNCLTWDEVSIRRNWKPDFVIMWLLSEASSDMSPAFNKIWKK